MHWWSVSFCMDIMNRNCTVKIYFGMVTSFSTWLNVIIFVLLSVWSICTFWACLYRFLFPKIVCNFLLFKWKQCNYDSITPGCIYVKLWWHMNFMVVYILIVYISHGLWNKKIKKFGPIDVMLFFLYKIIINISKDLYIEIYIFHRTLWGFGSMWSTFLIPNINCIFLPSKSKAVNWESIVFFENGP